MNKTTISILLAAAVLLSACAPKNTTLPQATPTPTNSGEATIPADATDAPQPAETATVEASAYQSFYSADGDFSLALPPDWTISAAQAVALGTRVTLGADPQSENDSAFILADAAKVSPEQAAQALCPSCAQTPELQKAELNGQAAQMFVLGGEETPPVEWYLLVRNQKLILLSLHDPETFASLDALLQSFTAGAGAGSGPKYSPAAWSAQQAYSADIGSNPYEIRVTTIDPVTWADACLGLPGKDEKCSPDAAAGYIGMLQTREAQAEFHTNENGSQVRLLPGSALAARDAFLKKYPGKPAEVVVQLFERTDWPDTCLSLPKAGETCATDPMPGYKIILRSGNHTVEYHTDLGGSDVRQVP